LHAPSVQDPAVHEVLAFGKLHMWPQLPQLEISVFVLTSQPLVGFPSQLANPALHEPIEQRPPVQAGLPFVTAGQTVPQPPQFVTLEFVFISHPLERFPSQLAKPALHDPIEQAPAVQAAVPFVTAGQTTPQAPQFDRSVFVFTSHPLDILPSQFANPGLQEAIEHKPMLQPGFPLATEQICPQLPQLLGSALVFISQPSEVNPLQFKNPALQVPITQAPPEQAAEALANIQA